MEDHRHPASRLEDPAVFVETALHQALVFGESLFLEFVDDRLGRGVGDYLVPRFDKKVQVGVEDVLAEGRIGEDVVDRIVREIQICRRARVHDRLSQRSDPGAECLSQALQCAREDVPRTTLGVLGGDIVDAGQILIDLRKAGGSISIKDRSRP